MNLLIENCRRRAAKAEVLRNGHLSSGRRKPAISARDFPPLDTGHWPLTHHPGGEPRVFAAAWMDCQARRARGRLRYGSGRRKSGECGGRPAWYGLSRDAAAIEGVEQRRLKASPARWGSIPGLTARGRRVEIGERLHPAGEMPGHTKCRRMWYWRPSTP